MTSTDVSYRSAGALAADIEAGVLSPVEVMDATLERIEEREPSLNAIVYRGFDEARESARAAQEAVSRGEPGGTLRGVPVLMKDLFDFKPGWPATFGGIPAMADFTLDAYCVWAERMEAAGAIIVGKGNSPALGFRGACDNYLFGPTSNPFDTTKNSGGSSGGSAAVVASSRSPKAPMAAAPSASRPPGVGWWGTSPPPDGCPRCSAPMPSQAYHRSSTRARSPGMWATPPWP
jgi:amidase/aspartyl-tRNA(Asn)/glutamyl-tRNA(Gln) amidotransferase subunit A